MCFADSLDLPQKPVVERRHIDFQGDGLGLFAATLLLVIRGGQTVGPHLGLLGIYLPGYEVTLMGAVLGLLYGLVIGYAAGFLVGALYNRLVKIA